VACGFCVCFVLFIFSCPGLFLSFSFSHSCFPFYLTVSLAEVVVTVDLAVVVMCLQDMQSQNYVSKKKKSFYNQIIMKNKGEEAWRTTFPGKKERKKEKNSLSTSSPIQVVKFYSSASSSLVICLQVTKIYLLTTRIFLYSIFPNSYLCICI